MVLRAIWSVDWFINLLNGTLQDNSISKSDGKVFFRVVLNIGFSSINGEEIQHDSCVPLGISLVVIGVNKGDTH